MERHCCSALTSVLLSNEDALPFFLLLVKARASDPVLKNC